MAQEIRERLRKQQQMWMAERNVAAAFDQER